MYDNSTYQYLRDYIKPLLDNIHSKQGDILTALTSEESVIGKSLLDLIGKAGSILVYVQHILWVLMFLVFLYFGFQFLQKRWFTYD